jgi:molybdenum cofactor cytidylyltransferase
VISGILLAAGAARRFGSAKLLQHLSDGTPVGLRSLRNLQAALEHVVVVTRAGDELVRSLYSSANAHIVVCHDADQGMGHSLAAGVAYEAQARGWIVALADMPNIRPETIRSIADKLSEGGVIVVPYFGSERGHPVGFGETFKFELLALRGDSGARAILQAHPEAIRRLDFNDPGILQDVDTPQDLQRVIDSMRPGKSTD